MHNHPGGDPTPSRADIEMKRVIVEVAEPIGIEGGFRCTTISSWARPDTRASRGMQLI
jgi:proteasome lid subunit RPN8/RPN11